MFTIALIDINNETTINDFIKFDKTDNDNLIKKFVEFSNMNNDDFAETTICYQEKETLYQLCYLTQNNNSQKNKSPNIFSSYLMYDNKAITGKTMLIKTHLPIDNYDMYNVDITNDDINNILYYKKSAIGVIINNTTNQLSEKEYIYDNIKFDKYEKLEISLYRYNLEVFYKKNGVKNKIASKLFCQDMYDDIYIFSKITEDIYDNLYKDDIQKMIDLSTGNLDDIKLSEDELKKEKDNEGRDIIKSKYRILYNKHKKLYNE